MDRLITENESNHHPPPAIPMDNMETIDLETDTEQLERQIEELTKQLHESITLEIS